MTHGDSSIEGSWCVHDGSCAGNSQPPLVPVIAARRTALHQAAFPDFLLNTPAQKA
jgi:hypothetical protein